MPSPPKLATLRADAANVPLAPVSTTDIPKLPVPVKITPARPQPRELVSKPAPEPRATPDVPRIQAEANVPLPPSLAADLVAVSLAPAPPEEEIVVPQGSRSGEFHASPQGTDMESGPVPSTSDVVATSTEPDAAVAEFANREPADIRVPGLSVSGSSAPQPGTVVQDRSDQDFKRLLARVSRPSLVPEISRERPLESDFFGSRRVYTTYLNMPNLTSGSGSWVLRFAELEEESAAVRSELSTPEPVRKVDPMYVPSAVREKIQGTVMLAALLLKDGSVANIRVVRSLDSRLDSSAVSALTQWQFRPAMRNGAAVNLEVLVQIPFRLPSF
jgi:TonB family protein